MNLTKSGFTVIELLIIAVIVAVFATAITRVVRQDRARERTTELLTQIAAAETFAQADSLRRSLQGLSETERLVGQAADRMADLAYRELEEQFLTLSLAPIDGDQAGEIAKRMVAARNHLTRTPFRADNTCGTSQIAVMGFYIQPLLDSARVRSLRKSFTLLQGAAKFGIPARDVSDAMQRDFACLEPRLPNLLAARQAGFRLADFLSLTEKTGANR